MTARSARVSGTERAGACRVAPVLVLSALLWTSGLGCGLDWTSGLPRTSGGRASPASSAATVELRLLVGPVSQPGVAAVEVRPAWGGLSSGPRRDAGWRRLPVVTRLGHLGVGGGQHHPVPVVRGTIAAGTYDRVFVAVPEVVTVSHDGERRLARSHIEPIALRLTVPPSGSTRVDIELAILPGASDGDGRLEVFVSNARVAQADAAGSLDMHDVKPTS